MLLLLGDRINSVLHPSWVGTLSMSHRHLQLSFLGERHKIMIFAN